MTKDIFIREESVNVADFRLALLGIDADSSRVAPYFDSDFSGFSSVSPDECWDDTWTNSLVTGATIPFTRKSTRLSRLRENPRPAMKIPSLWPTLKKLLTSNFVVTSFKTEREVITQTAIDRWMGQECCSPLDFINIYLKRDCKGYISVKKKML